MRNMHARGQWFAALWHLCAVKISLDQYNCKCIGIFECIKAWRENLIKHVDSW